MVRGVRLAATGLVDRPDFGILEAGPPPEPVAYRRVYTGGEWHDDVPVYDGEALVPGPAIVGPAVIQSRFTALVLRPGDRAVVQPNGDALVSIGRGDRDLAPADDERSLAAR